MSETIVLTAFEQQVLDALAQVTVSYWESMGSLGSPSLPAHIPPPLGITDTTLQSRGCGMFGPSWGGAKAHRHYPAILAALGRLRRKGLVRRRDNQYATVQWGYWSLTNPGRLLVGIECLPDDIDAELNQ